jgi:hypothetical protein
MPYLDCMVGRAQPVRDHPRGRTQAKFQKDPLRVLIIYKGSYIVNRSSALN